MVRKAIPTSISLDEDTHLMLRALMLQQIPMRTRSQIVRDAIRREFFIVKRRAVRREKAAALHALVNQPRRKATIRRSK